MPPHLPTIARLVEERLERDDPALDRAIDLAVERVYELTDSERALVR